MQVRRSTLDAVARRLARKYTPQKLHIYEGGRNSISGIRATVFGATGSLGSYVGAKLGYISSDVIFPSTSLFPYSDEHKELKLCAALGKAWIVRQMNFNDQRMVDRMVANSNVVINLCGPRKRVKHLKDFEQVNIDVARRVARACRDNPNIIRLIHFSAAGAAPDSPSLDLQTKWYGEQAVLEEFPNATILRPTQMFGMNDYLIDRFRRSVDVWYSFFPVFNDCEQKRQPIYFNDVAQCVLNALKLHETCGKTYELGGPNVLTRREMYELMINILNRPIRLQYINSELAKAVAKTIINWRYFSYDELVKEDLDLVVDPKARKIDELYVKPVSFSVIAEKILGQYTTRILRKTEENTEH